MCYLKRRNLLFKEYEKAMFSWAGKVQAFVKNYSDTIFSWSAEAKEWNVLGIGKNHDDRDRGDWASCRKRIKKRWGQRFKASGRKTVNTDIIERTGKIAEFFSYIDADAKSKFTGGKYWLLDPLMPGGYNQSVDFQNYGEGRFSMWSSDKDRYLGDNDKGYKQIYEGFTKRLPEFYKGLRKEIAADKFIYEPEIPSSYDLRGCIDKIDDPKCSRLKDWLTMIQDMAFVQMLTYSHHTKNRYKYF